MDVNNKKISVRLEAITVSAQIDEEMTTNHVRWLLKLIASLQEEQASLNEALGAMEARAIAAESVVTTTQAREDGLVEAFRAIAAMPELETKIMLDPNRMGVFGQGALYRVARGESISAMLLDPLYRRAATIVSAMLQASDMRRVGRN